MTIQEFNTNDLCLFASDLMSKLPVGAVNSIYICLETHEVKLKVNGSRELIKELYTLDPDAKLRYNEEGTLIWETGITASPINIVLTIVIYL